MTTPRPGDGTPRGFDLLDPTIQHHVVNTLRWPALRPLQERASGPILRGEDALLIAPTAGGKTEAALFPRLTRMSSDRWRGTSVLYVCPLKALLNNVQVRASTYASWLGRTSALRHGDTGAAERRHQMIDPPDLLLTTPESLESLLMSRVYTPRDLLGGVRAVIVDEVHAFAGDDRGWHLLAVLERVAELAGRPLQRVGCSATVGNAETLLAWLQGGNRGDDVPATVVAPAESGATPPEVEVDYVGSVENAATVVAALHRGKKRLVFADSRRAVEQLASGLRQRDVSTYVSHSSLSLDERRQAEKAFVEARDTVIVSTSTLELGVDVGDLDRVIQLGSPTTVASFLQRLGRTGRRPGTTRNMLFLAPEDETLLRSLGLMLLWSEGYVEPLVAPARPLHIVAQQVLAQLLQRRRALIDDLWRPLARLGMCSRGDFDEIVAHLVDHGFMDVDGGLFFVGPTAEATFGRINFRDLMAVFLAAPQVDVYHGELQVGQVDPLTFLRKQAGPHLLALGGRAWKVLTLDWRQRRVQVEPVEGVGSTWWSGQTPGYGAELSGAIRRVLQGAEPEGVRLTRRAVTRLAALREEFAPRVTGFDPMVFEEGGLARWWSWAGLRQNAQYVAALQAVAPELLSEQGSWNNATVALAPGTTGWAVESALREARERYGNDLAAVPPSIDPRAIEDLKFADLLPLYLALEAAAAR